MIRHALLIGLMAGALALPAAAAPQQFGAWSVDCVDAAKGRRCTMTTAPQLRVRGHNKPSPPVILTWSAVNEAMGIVESAEAAVDAETMSGWRLLAVVDGDDLLARADTNDRLPSSPMRERLLAGQAVTLMLVHEGRGNRASARVAADGFAAAHTELMHELKDHNSNRH